MSETGRKSVVVGAFNQPHEADLVRSILDAEGIASELEGEYTIGANPLFANVVGGMRIRVAEPDAAAASRILDEYRRNRAESDARRARACPQCGSEEVKALRRSAALILLAVLTFGAFILLFPWSKYQCAKCGERWK